MCIEFTRGLVCMNTLTNNTVKLLEVECVCV